VVSAPLKHSDPTRSRWTDPERLALGTGGIFVLATLYLQLLYVGHQTVSHNANVWFSDGGLLLLTAQRLLDGAVLYRDSFYQYGPLHMFAYAGWGCLFGNTIDSYFGFLNVVSTINTLLLVRCLRRAECSVAEMSITLAATLPYFLLPGSPSAGFYGHGYLPFERMLYLVFVLMWKAPSHRSIARSGALGAIIGLMQTVKFGDAAGALAGLLAVDAFSFWSASATPFWRGFWRHAIGIGTGFSVVVGAFAAVLYSCLPSEIASDVLWPYYMVKSYVVAPVDRLPQWLSLNYFIGTQLSAVIAVVIGVVTIGVLGIRVLGVRKRRAGIREDLAPREKGALPLIILLVAYLVNAVLIYKQTWLFYQNVWMVTAAVCFLVRRFPVSGKLALAVLCIPCLWITVRAVLWPRSDRNEEPVQVPNGETIWMDPAVKEQNTLVCESLRSIPPESGRVFVLDRGPVTVASHLHFFYKIPQASRHTMIFPGWLRPVDYRKLLQGLEATKAVVLIQTPTDPPPGKFIGDWNAYDFPREFSTEFSARLDSPVRAGVSCWIFPVIGHVH
jgi:hypothetical protein